MTKEVQSVSNNLGLISVLLGIIGISAIIAVLLSPLIALLGIGITGLIFSIKQNKVSKNRWAKSGIIINILVILISIVLLIISIIYLINNPETLSQLYGA